MTKMQILNEYLSNARWKNAIDYYLSWEKMQGILTRDSGIPGEKCDLLSSFMKESKQ